MTPSKRDIRRALRLPRRGVNDVHGEVDEELAFHIAMREANLRARGLSAEQAAIEARRRFGDMRDIRAECLETDRRISRREWLGARIHDIRRESRAALRSLQRAPGFAITSVLLLALGIGGSTAVFSIVNAIYFRPLPYPTADRLVSLSLKRPDADASCDRRCVRSPSSAEVAAWSDRAPSLEMIGTIAPRQGPVSIGGGTLVLEGAAVTSAIPPMLGLRAEIGRGLLPADFVPDATPVIALSHSMWQNDLGGDSTSVGRLFTIDGIAYRVVGVLAPSSELGPPLFSLNVFRAQYVVPMRDDNPGSYMQVVARLRPATTIAKLTSELGAIRVVNDDAMTNRFEWRPAIEPLRDALSQRYRASFIVLLAAVAVVLVATCMNVAGLLVARLNDRMPELATRTILGASRMQLVHQVATETMIVALAGGALGLGVAFYGTQLARLIPVDRLPFWTPIVMDARVGLVGIGLAVLGGLALSFAPLMVLSPSRVVAGLRDLMSAAPQRVRLRKLIVGAEIALSVMLLSGAALLIRQLINAERRDLGMAKQSVIYVFLLGRSMDVGDVSSWLVRVATEMRAVPGVVDVAAQAAAARVAADRSERRPGASRAAGRPSIVVEGRDGAIEGNVAPMQAVSATYFDVFGTPIVAGRAFTAEDRADATPVVIIDEASARRFFPHQSAISRRIRIDRNGAASDWLTIVGVSANVRGDMFSSDEAAHPALYRPIAQVPAVPSSLLVRVRDDADARRIIPLVRAAFQRVDPSSPIAGLMTTEESIDRRMWEARFNTRVLAGFAGFAVVLACLGVYATIAYAVGRRRRELAIRSALGATRVDVITSVLRSATAMIACGLAIGVIGSLGASRVLRALLYGQANPLDAPLLMGVVAVVGAAGCLAALLPALRAARGEPSLALRGD